MRLFAFAIAIQLALGLHIGPLVTPRPGAVAAVEHSRAEIFLGGYKKKPYLERLKGPTNAAQGRMAAKANREAKAAAAAAAEAKAAAAEAAAAAAEEAEAEAPPAEE